MTRIQSFFGTWRSLDEIFILCTMSSNIAIHLLPWLTTAMACFYFAIQTQLGHIRQTLNIAHVASTAMVLRAGGLKLIPYPQIWVPFFFGVSMHTASVLFIDKRVLDLRSVCLIKRIRLVYSEFSNIRRLSTTKTDSTLIRANEEYSTMGMFAALKCAHLLFIWVANQIITERFIRMIHHFEITYEDFLPDKQGLLPPTSAREVFLRAFMSVHWIWSTYAVFSTGHNMLSILFVCILRWDMPCDWPSLFGSVTEAYSLRRFWGVFWQRLHIAPFEAFMPSNLILRTIKNRLSGPGNSRLRTLIFNSFRAFWMFFLSAICHAAVSWIVKQRANSTRELRFFLSNYAVCLFETAGERTLGGKAIYSLGVWRQAFGYVWVFAVFFALVPAWQYPLVYEPFLI